MRKKQFYEAPDAELLVVRFEENFCQTGGDGYSTPGSVPETGDDDNQGGF